MEETIAAGDSGPRREPGQVLPRGATLGRYVVLSFIGAGGMGEVYAAYDPELDRKVAIKLLHLGGGASTSGTSGGEARLLREAQAMARLTHPNVITVHDVGTFEGQVFVAMEFVEGETLADWMESPHPWAEVLERFVAAGQGLAAAHRAELIHRDFKPENVLLGADGRVLVADFGLARGFLREAPDDAKTSAEEAVVPSGINTSSLDEQLTMTGALMGTPAYMSPEQHLGVTVDARSDQFSFCVALYEGLYRQRPFAGETLAALSLAVAQGKVREPPGTSDAGRVPGWLRSVVMRGLAKRAVDRHPSMDALLREIERRPKARQRRIWGGLGATVLAVGLGVGYGASPGAADPCSGVEHGLDGVWDAAKRAELEQAMAATEVSYAADVTARVSTVLDAYADAYRGAARDACEATRVRHEQSDRVLDLRNTCLARRKHQLEESVALLLAADAEMVEQASTLIDALPSLEPCADVEALAARVPPPEDPEVRAAVEALAAEVARGEAMLAGAKLKEGHALALDLVARAQDVDHAPLQAETVALLGRAESGLGLPEAESTLKRAAAMALASGHDEVFIDVALRLMISLGQREDRHDEVALWTQLGEAELDRVDAGDRRRASFMVAKAESLRHREDPDAALAVIEEAIALRERSGASPLELAAAQRTKSIVLYDKGELGKARDMLTATLEIYRDGYGPDHPKVIPLLNNLAAIHLATSDYAAARGLLEEVVEKLTRILGPDNLGTIDVRSNLGLVLIQLGELDEAERHLRRVLEVYSGRFGENSDVGECMANLAEVVERQGRLEEARELTERAGAIFQKNDPKSWRYGMTLLALAVMDREAGDTAAAVEKARRSLELVRPHFGVGHPRTNGVELELARAEVAAGEQPSGRQRLERFIPAFSGENADAVSLASARYWLGLALMPDVDEARASMVLARQDLENSVGLDTELLRANIDAWLAEHPGS